MTFNLSLVRSIDSDFLTYAGPRHACDQDDGLEGYAWTKHDGREAGTQVLKDPSNNVELTTEFLKTPGGAHGVLRSRCALTARQAEAGRREYQASRLTRVH